MQSSTPCVMSALSKHLWPFPGRAQAGGAEMVIGLFRAQRKTSSKPTPETANLAKFASFPLKMARSSWGSCACPSPSNPFPAIASCCRQGWWCHWVAPWAPVSLPAQLPSCMTRGLQLRQKAILKLFGRETLCGGCVHRTGEQQGSASTSSTA